MENRLLIREVNLRRKHVIVAGRITAIRKMKNICFFDLVDVSGKIQIVVNVNNTLPSVGDIVAVEGDVMKTKTGQLSIKSASATVLSKAINDIASVISNKISISDRSVREYRAMELIVDDDLKRMIKARSIFITTIRDFMRQKDFLDVDTPVISPLRFAGTADAFEVKSKSLNRTLYLRGTLEDYLKQLIVSGFEKVFQIGDCFRNESPALIEFTMLEATWAYGESRQMLEMIFDLIKQICKNIPDDLVNVEAKRELMKDFKVVTFWGILEEYFGVDIRSETQSNLRKIAKKMNYELQISSKNYELEVAKFGYDTIKRILSKEFKQPTFVGKFPAIISPLARNLNNPENEADRGYGFFRGQRLFEVVSESSSFEEQFKKFQEQDNRNPSRTYSFKNDALLEALRCGCPPMAGLGFNINRVLAVLLDKNKTSDVLAFPITSAPLPL